MAGLFMNYHRSCSNASYSFSRVGIAPRVKWDNIRIVHHQSIEECRPTLHHARGDAHAVKR